MSELYITLADRLKLVAKWLNISMWSLHIWGYAFAAAIIWLSYLGKDTTTLEKVFWTVCLGIGLTLAVLLIDKFSDALITRFSTVTKTREETSVTTKTEVKK